MNTRLTALAAAATLAAVLGPQASAAPAKTSSDAAAGQVAAKAAPTKMALTFEIDDCEGCVVQLMQARETLDADVVHTWASGTRAVEGGKVTFRLPPRRTSGMSVTVRAPWEGRTGYATTVAWRYNGKRVGDAVTLEEAVTKKRASACWEGTRRRDVTIPVVVEEVEVDGIRGRVPGSIAFVAETMPWLDPMRRVVDGVLGSQDVNLCR